MLCSWSRSIRSVFNRFSAASVARVIAFGEKSCGISQRKISHRGQGGHGEELSFLSLCAPSSSVVKLTCAIKTGSSTANRRPRLDGESGFEHANAGARGGDSAPEDFCGCGVRVLE